MTRRPSKLNAVKLLVLRINLPLLAIGFLLGVWSYSTTEFEGVALRDEVFSWVFIVYATTAVLVYAVSIFSPIVLVLHALSVVFIVPARVDDLGAALCEEVATQGITNKPHRRPFPGPFYPTNKQLTFFRDNDLWRGHCSYSTGSYGANRGPHGEEFFIQFYRGHDRETFIRLRLDFNLRSNLVDMIPEWLSDPSHPLMLKNNPIKPDGWAMRPDFWRDRPNK